jgi:CheY-like chemotaxis protein
MTNKTRVLHVRVVGFSAPEKQMLNSIFLLSVAPARQIGYKLWNAETGTAPDMYLLDGDSESAVASWQAAFSNTSDRTLVVGSKNTDLGVTSAARPLGLKVVGAMDRLAIALNNVANGKHAKEGAGHDVSAPRAGGPATTLTGGTLPSGAGSTLTGTTGAGATLTGAANAASTLTGAANAGATLTGAVNAGATLTGATLTAAAKAGATNAGATHTGAMHAGATHAGATASATPPAASVADTGPATHPKQNASLPRVSTPPAAPAPAMSASLNASLNSLSSNAVSPNAQTMTATLSAALPPTHAGTLPTSMTASAPAATVLPNVTLQPSVTLQPNAAPLDKVFEKSLNERSINERSLTEKPVTEKAVDRILSEKLAAEKPVLPKVEIEKTPAEKIQATAASLMASGVTPLTPAALSAVVGTSAARGNLRVVPSASPMAASLPSATSTQARIADAPMMAAPPISARIADVPMSPPPAAAPVASPAAATPAPPPAAPAMAPAVTPAAPPVYSSGAAAPRQEDVFRVLAVDDSPLMRTFLQNKLAPYGISPEFAASGEEALFKISKQHYDMIFLDVMLPGMDGYDVCKMIKKNKDNNLMKVVMLTSKDKTFDKIRGTMAGCDGYLTKPVDEIKLRAIIERHTVTRK